MFPISLKGLSDQKRHDYILRTFVLNKSATGESRTRKRDIDVIREHHRFLWDSADPPSDLTWEEKLARRYYDQLFKEYCIADLTRHKENKVALRWRTEAEVISGKGQFQCGSRKCEEREGLRTWEVNFAYQEQGERKNALVKLRLCAQHTGELNYTSKKREVKRLKKHHAREKKLIRQQKKRHLKGIHTDSDESDEEADQAEVEEKCEASPKPPQESQTTEELEGEAASAKDNTSEDIWSRQTEMEAEHQARETDFERYLEDLLL